MTNEIKDFLTRPSNDMVIRALTELHSATALMGEVSRLGLTFLEDFKLEQQAVLWEVVDYIALNTLGRCAEYERLINLQPANTTVSEGDATQAEK